MLANRLKKNLARLGPWAKRERLEAYRLYDRDIPDIPWAVDLYGRHAVVSEYIRPVARRQDDRERDSERAGVIQAVVETLKLQPEHVHVKTRERHDSQAREAHGDASHEFALEEHGHQFLVNLDDYLDTGLFLDHRNARRMVGERCAGASVLNLFCYTGAFTVYAAKGGAVSSVSVDLSATYLGWAGRNLALNGIDPKQHALVRADVFEYLRKGKSLFDQIVLDPPTLSRSAKGKTFSMQGDHVELINLALSRLAPNGVLLFSTNYRQFQLREKDLAAREVREITEQTHPKDFREIIHRCWEMRL